jgi:hypothetical protein
MHKSIHQGGSDRQLACDQVSAEIGATSSEFDVEQCEDPPGITELLAHYKQDK